MMSVYDFYKRKLNVTTNSTGKNYPTLGEKIKAESDMVMELTWDHDLQSKVCYIYDYFHDDQKNKKDHMTYENTTKTRIDAKFIVKSYQSLDKDQVDYYLQFRPSQPTEFVEGDELYYFEKEYRQKYHNEDFIGMYIDVPDDRGIYRKWIIARKEYANQFVKYLIIPCNYELMWIEVDGNKRIKRRMWSALKMQSSYNSGVWRDYNFTSQENQNKCWLPLNSITEKIWYTSDINQNMRILVGAYTENPVAWSISKVENANNLGIQQLTLYQDSFNQHRDYIEKDSDGNIIGLWADYYPIEAKSTDQTDDMNIVTSLHARISASTSTIKIGGSYKILSAMILDENGENITERYADAEFNWTCCIDEKDFTVNKNVIAWLNGFSFNKKKIKFLNDRSYLQKVLEIRCSITKDNTTLYTCEKFKLVI